MILIVSHAEDEAAQNLVNHFPSGKAVLLTPLSLTQPGLTILSNDFTNSFVTLQEQKIFFSQISGVITLTPAVFDWELVHIEKTYRTFVAQEITACLTYVLAELSCPKLNAPTATCLSGQNWRSEHWIKLAHRLEIPVRPVVIGREESASALPAQDSKLTVTVIGNRCNAVHHTLLANQAFSLARKASLEMLQVNFVITTTGQHFFQSATQFPDLNDEWIRNSIVNYFIQDH